MSSSGNSESTQYRLPDLLRNWPWTRHLSPHYARAKKESSAWVASFRPFKSKGQKAFDACDLNFVRAGCDLMNFYFVYDEYTDIADASVANELATIVIENMTEDSLDQDVPSSSSTHILGQMTRQFWKRASTLAKPGSPCFAHFIATSERYLRAVSLEAEDRAMHRVRSFDDYFILRRDTCGARPTLALIEFGLDLPEEVTSDPVIQALTQDAVDLIILVNDMHSYIREISCGLADHNVLTPIMRDYNLDLQSALNWMDTYTSRVIERFLSNQARMPSWGPDIDARVRMYIDGLGQWVRGNDDWSCEGKRYHGSDGLVIRDTRMVTICPRKANYIQEDENPELVVYQLGTRTVVQEYGEEVPGMEDIKDVLH
uniref:Terpene synthase n=1 Tax=Psilocybe cubensis TaxID=181762 RepID=A0A8H7XMK6_PSICU